MNKKLKVMLKDMDNAASGQLSNRHFTDGQFLKYISPMDSSLMNNSPKESSPKGLFPQKTFPQQRVPRMIFPGKDILPNHMFHFRSKRVIDMN